MLVWSARSKEQSIYSTSGYITCDCAQVRALRIVTYLQKNQLKLQGDMLPCLWRLHARQAHIDCSPGTTLPAGSCRPFRRLNTALRDLRNLSNIMIFVSEFMICIPVQTTNTGYLCAVFRSWASFSANVSTVASS